MIPFPYLESLLQAPAGYPAFEAEAIQLIWGVVNLNFCGFRGIPSLCCRVVDRKGIFLERGGCQGEAPASWYRSSCARQMLDFPFLIQIAR